MACLEPFVSPGQIKMTNTQTAGCWFDCVYGCNPYFKQDVPVANLLRCLCLQAVLRQHPDEQQDQLMGYAASLSYNPRRYMVQHPTTDAAVAMNSQAGVSSVLPNITASTVVEPQGLGQDVLHSTQQLITNAGNSTAPRAYSTEPALPGAAEAISACGMSPSRLPIRASKRPASTELEDLSRTLGVLARFSPSAAGRVTPEWHAVGSRMAAASQGGPLDTTQLITAQTGNGTAEQGARVSCNWQQGRVQPDTAASQQYSSPAAQAAVYSAHRNEITPSPLNSPLPGGESPTGSPAAPMIMAVLESAHRLSSSLHVSSPGTDQHNCEGSGHPGSLSIAESALQRLRSSASSQQYGNDLDEIQAAKHATLNPMPDAIGGDVGQTVGYLDGYGSQASDVCTPKAATSPPCMIPRPQPLAIRGDFGPCSPGSQVPEPCSDSPTSSGGDMNHWGSPSSSAQPSSPAYSTWGSPASMGPGEAFGFGSPAAVDANGGPVSMLSSRLAALRAGGASSSPLRRSSNQRPYAAAWSSPTHHLRQQVRQSLELLSEQAAAQQATDVGQEGAVPLLDPSCLRPSSPMCTEYATGPGNADSQTLAWAPSVSALAPTRTQLGDSVTHTAGRLDGVLASGADSQPDTPTSIEDTAPQSDRRRSSRHIPSLASRPQSLLSRPARADDGRPSNNSMGMSTDEEVEDDLVPPLLADTSCESLTTPGRSEVLERSPSDQQLIIPCDMAGDQSREHHGSMGGSNHAETAIPIPTAVGSSADPTGRVASQRRGSPSAATRNDYMEWRLSLEANPAFQLETWGSPRSDDSMLGSPVGNYHAASQRDARICSGDHSHNSPHRVSTDSPSFIKSTAAQRVGSGIFGSPNQQYDASPLSTSGQSMRQSFDPEGCMSLIAQHLAHGSHSPARVPSHNTTAPHTDNHSDVVDAAATLSSRSSSGLETALEPSQAARLLCNEPPPTSNYSAATYASHPPVSWGSGDGMHSSFSSRQDTDQQRKAPRHRLATEAPLQLPAASQIDIDESDADGVSALLLGSACNNMGIYSQQDMHCDTGNDVGDQADTVRIAASAVCYPAH